MSDVLKRWKFPMVSLPGVGHMPAPGEDEKETARVFYVAANRATQRLAMAAEGGSDFAIRLIYSSVEKSLSVSSCTYHQANTVWFNQLSSK
ncbi:hypothetical protein [Rhodoferax antarcticus]|uniref:hypothetical protein n=1 Tax=Rhodoferax antarcticus TaxID=81479 RepID=UPI00094F7301|nr:hypothetical protein [Rhodoferax antarcticus]APW47171.1 hypothetical protein RA876_13300 [Rhodoferax antarcticus]